MGLVPVARVGVFRHDAQQVVQGRADRAGQEVRGSPVQNVAGADKQESVLTSQQKYQPLVSSCIYLLNHLLFRA